MLRNRSTRKGFTLPEVLVTVAIVAVLAAVVVPAVTQQIGKGDAPAFSSSVNSLRTAMTSFVSDTRRFPGQVDHLQLAIDGSDLDLGGVTFNPAAVNGWKGPYENSGTTNGLMSLGYGWTTANQLRDSLNYLVIALGQTGADTVDAHELDVALDGGNGGTAGFVRYNATTSGSDALTPADTIFLFLMSSAR